MLNLIEKLNSKQSATIVKGAAKLARNLGCTVRQERDGHHRYFIQTADDHYIISARSMKKRPVETVQGETYDQYHAGFLSLYKERTKPDRQLWDVQQRDAG